MNTNIKNIGNIVVSDRKLSLFSDIQTGLALSKWPPIGLKFGMVVDRTVIFKIRVLLEGSEILRYIVILPNPQPVSNKFPAWTFLMYFCPPWFPFPLGAYPGCRRFTTYS
jgi:hypothetical protein